MRDFWHDHDFPYYLVTVKPYDRDHGSSDGSGFTNAFWMYVSRLDSLAPLLPQLAHEAFHLWSPGRMGPLLSHDDQSTNWFWEGFTDYYGKLLVYRAGELPISEYIAAFNRQLRQFPTSDDPDVRGPVIALWLDDAIRRESQGRRSLDDLMFDMVKDSHQPLTLARIFDTAAHYLSPTSIVLLQHAVLDHDTLPAPDRIPSVGACVHAFEQNLYTYDLGLDKAHSFAAGKVVGVVPDGPAFAAGLRDGQTIGKRYSIPYLDPDREALITIHTDQGDREIRYYPRGKQVATWQYRLDPAIACEPLH